MRLFGREPFSLLSGSSDSKDTRGEDDDMTNASDTVAALTAFETFKRVDNCGLE